MPTRPANNAACCQFSSAALTPKYVCAASCTPKAPLPNETRPPYPAPRSSVGQPVPTCDRTLTGMTFGGLVVSSGRTS